MIDLGVAPSANVTVSHGGFSCRQPLPKLKLWLLTVLPAIVYLAGVFALAEPTLPWIIPGVVWLPLAAAIQNTARVRSVTRFLESELRVEGRRLVLDVPRRTETHMLDDVDRVFVAKRPDDYSVPYLAIEVGEHTLRFGEGLSVETLRWLVAAVDSACDLRERQEEAEGREYSFEQRAPEMLEQLRSSRED